MTSLRPTPAGDPDGSLRALVAQVEERLATRDHAAGPDGHEPSLGHSALRHAARRESRLLVAAVLDRTPASVSAGCANNEELSAEAHSRVRAAAERLAQGMPFAYAVGSAAFRHLLLTVDPRVLIPRPETELLVDHVLGLTQGLSGGLAVDLGTGSGAIALALAQEGTFARIIATDISEDALAVARANALRLAPELRVPVEFRLGADLAPLGSELVDVLVSNPPYIAYDEAALLPALVRDWEPPTALFAAEGGMARYVAILRGARTVVRGGGWVVLECDSARAADTLALANATGHFSSAALHLDLTGRPRLLVAQVTSS